MRRMLCACALFACGCDHNINATAEGAAARCAAPISSVLLTSSADGTRMYLRQNVAGAPWNAETRACLRGWATRHRVTFLDPAA